VVIAHDGVEAIELAALHHPDVILLALHDKRLSAPEAIQVFAEINATSAVPAIVLTPTDNGADGSNDDDRTSRLIRALPPGAHTVRQDEKLIRSLSDKLTELGIISP